MRIPSLLIAVAVALTACGGSDSTTNPPTTTPGGSTSPAGLNIAVDSGFTDRTVVVGTTVPAPVHVTLAGQGVANVTVTWLITAGGGKLATTSSVTNASGAASTQWTIGDTVRTNTLQATITGASATLQVLSIGGPPASLAKVSPDSSTVVAGASLLLSVRAIDRTGNPSSNVPVTWTTSTGVLTVTSTTTGPSGRAEVALTTNRTPGSYTVTATSAGLGTVSFKVVGL